MTLKKVLIFEVIDATKVRSLLLLLYLRAFIPRKQQTAKTAETTSYTKKEGPPSVPVMSARLAGRINKYFLIEQMNKWRLSKIAFSAAS